MDLKKEDNKPLINSDIGGNKSIGGDDFKDKETYNKITELSERI